MWHESKLYTDVLKQWQQIALYGENGLRDDVVKFVYEVKCGHMCGMMEGSWNPRDCDSHELHAKRGLSFIFYTLHFLVLYIAATTCCHFLIIHFFGENNCLWNRSWLALTCSLQWPLKEELGK